MSVDEAAPHFIASEIYRRSTYGRTHPLGIPRVSTAVDVSRALGWLPDDVYHASPEATPEQLARVHTRDYLAALIETERRGEASETAQRRHGLGANGNPVFPEMFRRPATACGAALLAASLVAEGGTVYSPGGGQHHGRPDRASGFCFLNEPAIGITALLDRGLDRILYLDLDAHHGDGVQDAFAGDRRVITCSIHEAGRWPMRRDGGPDQAGGAYDRGGGNALNLPVPAGFHDAELEYLMDTVVLPLIDGFGPQAIYLQCGADALADDPQSKLALSNTALWRAVAQVRDTAPRLVTVGGGGYNPWSVGRCWPGVWATLNGFEVPDRLPAAAEAVLRSLRWAHPRGRAAPEHWFTTLADRPHVGPIRDEVRGIARLALVRPLEDTASA